MINRFTLAAMTAAVTLSGCAKHSVNETVADFSQGDTLVEVTHLPARTADGATIFVTVDGSEAGALPVGESMALHVPAGAHQVGGYARSLIGRVTIPSVNITTAPDSTRYVAYTVTKSKPLFTELSEDPHPETPPVPAATKSESAKISPTVQKAEPAPAAETVQKPEIAQATSAAETTETAAAETAQATVATPAAEPAQTTEATPAAEAAQATETAAAVPAQAAEAAAATPADQTTDTTQTTETRQTSETAKTSDSAPVSESAPASETPQS